MPQQYHATGNHSRPLTGSRARCRGRLSIPRSPTANVLQRPPQRICTTRTTGPGPELDPSDFSTSLVKTSPALLLLCGSARRSSSCLAPHSQPIDPSYLSNALLNVLLTHRARIRPAPVSAGGDTLCEFPQRFGHSATVATTLRPFPPIRPLPR